MSRPGRVKRKAKKLPPEACLGMLDIAKEMQQMLTNRANQIEKNRPYDGVSNPSLLCAAELRDVAWHIQDIRAIMADRMAKHGWDVEAIPTSEEVIASGTSDD